MTFATTMPPVNVPREQRAVCYHPGTGELYAASDPAAWEFYKANYRKLGDAIAYTTCNRMPSVQWFEMVTDPNVRRNHSLKMRRMVG